MSILRNGKWFFFWNHQHHHFLQRKCKMNSASTFSSGLFIAENWRKRFLLRKRRVDRNILCWSDKGEKVGNTASQFTPKKILNLVVYHSPKRYNRNCSHAARCRVTTGDERIGREKRGSHKVGGEGGRGVAVWPYQEPPQLLHQHVVTTKLMVVRERERRLPPQCVSMSWLSFLFLVLFAF